MLTDLIETIYVKENGELKIQFHFQDEFHRAISVIQSRLVESERNLVELNQNLRKAEEFFFKKGL